MLLSLAFKFTFILGKKIREFFSLHETYRNGRKLLDKNVMCAVYLNFYIFLKD